ncbi:MAG TPA: MFS transporter [Rubrobacteraceae bacterium]|nr:MFS transporter [Rubrobacteraceae bacterium]
MTAGQDHALDNRKWLVLSAVSIGTFLSTLSSSIVNISLPTIAHDFGVGIADIEWIVVAYLLTAGSLLLTFGRLGDILGYKRVYIAGFALFTVTSVFCGLAQGVGELTIFRVLQGIGFGMVQAIGPAIITSVFSASERGRALGLTAVSISLGLTLGPTLGGVLTEWASWRWIFFVNLPVGLAGILWSWRVLPGGRNAAAGRFDPAGAFLVGTSMFCLLLALVEGEDWGWDSFRILGLFVAFAVLGAAFVITELRVRQPVFDLRLFAIRTFSADNVSLLIAFLALFVATFLMPFFLQRGQGFSVLEAGLLLTPLSLTTMVAAPISGTLSDKIGSRIIATAGLIVMGLGLAALARMDAGTGGWDVVWRLAVVGLGLGMFSSPNNSSVLGSVPRSRLGTASGMVAQMRITGQVLGIAAGGAILASRVSDHARELTGSMPQALVQRDALILSINDALYFAAAVCVLGALTSLVRGKRETGEAEPSSGSESSRALAEVSDRELLLTGLVLAHVARRIETANGSSPNLIRAASSLVEPNGEVSERARALRAGEEVLKPISRTLMLTYLVRQITNPERRRLP